MTRIRLPHTAVVATTLLTILLAMPVAASGPGWLTTLVGADVTDGQSDTMSAIEGDIAGLSMWSLGDPDPEMAAEDLETAYNSHSEAFTAAANDNLSADASTYNVVKIVLDADDEQATRYLVRPVDGGHYRSGAIRERPLPPGATEYVDTGDGYIVSYRDGGIRTRDSLELDPDVRLTVTGDAVDALDEDVRTIAESLKADGRLSSETASKLRAKYDGSISVTDLGGESDA